ncbi:MAG TPA: hypothetical protein VMB71_02120, partial [Acetobacteraceae bacterium]|nr:hypothetical protein [Acetobacteraceae bacterium]
MLTAITNMLLRRTLRRWFAHEPDVREIRRKLDRFITRLDAPPPGSTVTDARPAGGGTLHRITAIGDASPTAPNLLYFHGGGYIVGSLAAYLPFCGRLSRAIGGPV